MSKADAFYYAQNERSVYMKEQLKEIIAWLGMLGIPSIFAMTAWCIRSCMHYTKQLKILAKAQQAQMRSQLLEQYHFYVDDGWISEEHMEDWENQYNAYHTLGENGILDSRREELLKLPNKKPKKDEDKSNE